MQAIGGWLGSVARHRRKEVGFRVDRRLERKSAAAVHDGGQYGDQDTDDSYGENDDSEIRLWWIGGIWGHGRVTCPYESEFSFCR